MTRSVLNARVKQVRSIFHFTFAQTPHTMESELEFISAVISDDVDWGRLGVYLPRGLHVFYADDNGSAA